MLGLAPGFAPRSLSGVQSMRRASNPRFDVSETGNLLGTRIPLISLRQTLAVAQYLSFRQAALALGVSQSSVSERIKALEADLGIMLFERNTRGVRLTEAGRRFVAEVEQAMHILDRAVKTASMHARGEQGVLRIGVYALVAGGFLDTLLERFRGRNERIALEITEGSALDAQVQVREDRLDVAFMAWTHDIPDLNSRVIWHDRLMAVMPASHPLAARAHAEWKDLARETFIVREAGTGPQVHDLIVVRAAGRWPVPTIRRFDIGRGALLSMIAKGHGISLLAEENAATAPPGLAFRPIVDEPESIAFEAIWSPRNHSPVLRNLLGLARKLEGTRPEG